MVDHIPIKVSHSFSYLGLVSIEFISWKIQSELTPRANVSLTPENFLILTP